MKGLKWNKYADYIALSKLSNAANTKVLIIGLGHVGLPDTRYVKEKGFQTYEFDLSVGSMESAGNQSTKKAEKFRVLCVFQLIDQKMYCLQGGTLLSIATKLSKEAEAGSLVSIESTFPRGTPRKDFFSNPQRAKY